MTVYYFDVSGPGMEVTNGGMKGILAASKYLEDAAADGRLGDRQAPNAYENFAISGELLIGLARASFDDRLRSGAQHLTVDELIERIDPAAIYTIQYGDI